MSGAIAGGNPAAVMCQLAWDEGLSPPLTGQYLCVPARLWPDVVPEKWSEEYRSQSESVNDPVLKLYLKASKDLVATLKADISSPRPPQPA